MRVVTFGEIMLRLMPLGGQRWRQSLPGELSATYGGAEANVAVSIALQGERPRTAPRFPITLSPTASYRSCGSTASIPTC